ncbi:hypothetical protein WN943_001306 [Citrus x changshan-huyou]
MRRWSRSSSGRLIRKSQSPPPIMDENQGENVLGELNPQIDQGDNQSQHGHDQNQPRTLRDYMNPTRTGAPSCIVFPPEASRFNFKPGIIQLLPTFHGLESENPFKELLNICPHHGFETWRLVTYFYEGLMPQSRQVVEMMCNGEFRDKNPEDALDDLDQLAENAQHWDTVGTFELTNKQQSSPSSGGIHNLREDHDLQAKFASLVRKVEALEHKESDQVKSVQEIACNICNSNDHFTQECPTLPTLKECINDQANVINTFNKPNPYSQTYNPGWRNHPNFGWRNNNNAQSSQAPPPQNFQNPQPYAAYVPPPWKNLEDTMHSFIRKQDAINNQNAQTFSDLKDTLAKIAYALTIQEKGKFPAQPQPNPKIQQNPPTDQVKSVIILRSGKVVDRPMPEPYENDENSKGKEGLNELTPSEEITSVPPEPPFPHALNKPKKSNHTSEIYEIFKQVKVNIPLLYAIKQVPSYAKFLKDLCTVKRKLKVRKRAFMAEQTSQNYDDEPKFEELGSIEKIEQQEAPKMELKHLPEGLKYAFLGEEQTYHVVISSTLTSDQEGQRRNGKPIVIYYASKTLDSAQMNYSTTEKELLAVEFDLTIKDKKGAENVIADHLSRLTSEFCNDITPINDSFPDEFLFSVTSMPCPIAASSSKQFKNICVLSGFHYGKYKEFVQAVVDLGRVIAERKLHLVYGGGERGLSRLVSEAVFTRGSQVLGIIPKSMKPLVCMSGPPIGEELVVSSMQQRISEMINHADAFIFLPGDLATFEALITFAS